MRFSERHGFTSPRSVLQKDDIDVPLRHGLWNVLVGGPLAPFVNDGGYLQSNPAAHRIAISLWADFFILPVDQFSSATFTVLDTIRKKYAQLRWYEVYNLIEFFMNSGLFSVPLKEIFKSSCNRIIAREMSAYRIVGLEIARLTSDEEITTIEEALSQTGLLQPVQIHIETALRMISDRANPDYRNSIKESISAVESMCCIVTGASKATLTSALSKLEGQGVELHGALKEAFTKLYAYTSDADGIRHKLLEDPKLDFEDAKFMLVTCSAFVNYIKAKV